MKRTIVTLAVAFTASGACAPVAQAIEYRLDATLASYRWEEDVPPDPPQEMGPVVLLGGFVSGSPSASAPPLTLRGEIRMLAGRVNYDTSTIGVPSTPVNTHSAYIGFTQEGSVGWRVDGTAIRLEPFTGLAYRWWLRTVESSGSVSGYPELYRTVVWRLGARFEQRNMSGWRMFGAVSADPVVWAHEVIDLEDTTGDTLRVRNGKELGWTLELGLREARADVSLFWQAMRFGESNVVPCNIAPTFACLQPRSDQDIIGLRVGLSF
jgi:hypothetical protein